jgi:hypothetical protein
VCAQVPDRPGIRGDESWKWLDLRPGQGQRPTTDSGLRCWPENRMSGVESPVESAPRFLQVCQCDGFEGRSHVPLVMRRSGVRLPEAAPQNGQVSDLTWYLWPRQLITFWHESWHVGSCRAYLSVVARVSSGPGCAAPGGERLDPAG